MGGGGNFLFVLAIWVCLYFKEDNMKTRVFCGSEGFTLLELLVVLTIVSILSYIAVPNLAEYRMRAFDARAQSDLRNIAMAEEAYFLDHEEYLSCAGDACTALPGISRISDGVIVEINAQELFFIGAASHPQGTGITFEWNSAEGGLIN